VHGGYGQFMTCSQGKRKLLKAHRVSYEMANGPIPKGLFICHRCNNPKCCNPAHLYAGTAAENWNDTIAAGTRYVPEGDKGERHHDAKLTEAKVQFIRKSKQSGASLARKFGVSTCAVSAVRRGRTWKKVK
jgi:hypothetical protein